MDMYTRGYLLPIPRKSFSAKDIEQAFRHLQDGDHIGKVVVTMPQESSTLSVVNCVRNLISFHSEASYLITGGLGGLGKSILMWMAERGARNFVVVSRNAGKNEADNDFIKELQSMGCIVIPIAGKAEIREDIERAIASAPSKIKGVFHFAMAQQESPLLDLTHNDWTSVVAPKVDGAWNLHNSFIDHDLDFFVLASSLLVLVHQPNESNYAAASTFLEAFCQFRRNKGLPASILAICPIRDVGFVADRPTTRRNLQNQGLYFLGEKEFIDFVELAILNQYPHSKGDSKNEEGCFVNQGWIGMGVRSTIPLSDPRNRIHWRNDPKMGYFHNISSTSSISTPASKNDALATFLVSVRDDPTLLFSPENVSFLAKQILQQFLGMMMHEDKEIDIMASPQQLGVDSLLGIELRRWWKLTFGIEMTALEILGCASVKELGALTAEKLEEQMQR